MNLSELMDLETSGELLVDFGPQPVSNRFLTSRDLAEAPKFPLQLRLRHDSGLIHIGKPFPVDELRPRYKWLTCFEPEDHLDALVDNIIGLPGVSHGSVFGAYSFKDDSTLRRLENRGYGKTWRLDPETDFGIQDECANVETFQSVLTPQMVAKIRERRGWADVLIVRHVVEHAFNLPNFIRCMREFVKPGGYLIWELPDCERALVAGDCTIIWEEHAFYFTEATFKQLLNAVGCTVVHYESVPYALENSIIAIVRESKSNTITVNPDRQIIAKEVSRAIEFSKKVVNRQIQVRNALEKSRRDRGPIALFGAGHLSVAFLSLMGVADLVSCVLDDNAHKMGMRMPIGGLEIQGSESLYSGKFATCLLGLNPQNQPKVIGKHRRFLEQGGIFESIFPDVAVDSERYT
jgi:hypothetical protein